MKKSFVESINLGYTPTIGEEPPQQLSPQMMDKLGMTNNSDDSNSMENNNGNTPSNN